MIILRQKLYFERTKEMEETAENLNKAKESIKKSAKEVVEKVKHPGKTVKIVKDKIVKSVKNPKIIGKALKDTGKKAWNFAKKNPRYAVYMGAGYGVPILAGKVVEKKKGKKAGVATTATLTALPLGEAAIGLDKLVTSKGGRTGLKAAGQVIKGVVTDLGKKAMRKNKLKIKRFARADYAGLGEKARKQVASERRMLALDLLDRREKARDQLQSWNPLENSRKKYNQALDNNLKYAKQAKENSRKFIDRWEKYYPKDPNFKVTKSTTLSEMTAGQWDKFQEWNEFYRSERAKRLQKQQNITQPKQNPVNNPTTHTQPTTQKPTQTTQQPKPATQTTAPTNNSTPKPTQPTTPSTPKPIQTNTGGGSSLVNNKPKTSGGLVGFAKKNPRTTAMGALGLAAIGTGILAYNKNKQKKKDEQAKLSY